MNRLINIKKILTDLISFREPAKTETFILKETQREAELNEEKSQKKEERVKKKNEGVLTKLNSPKGDKAEEKEKGKKSDISSMLSENLNFIKEKFSVPTNGDIVIREFDIIVKDKAIPAFMVFIDGMVDRKVVNSDILQPLMMLSSLDIKSQAKDIAEYIKGNILPHNQIKEVSEHQDVVDDVNFGGCGIYIEGLSVAFTADVKGWQARGVERPNTELVIRGPQEGFNESLRGNTSLIRKRLKDENLIVENLQIGRRSKTPCSMLYIKDIANDSLVKEVRRRLKKIKVDHILDTGELEQFIEDNPFLPTPQVLATERPDRVSAMLAEGRVAIIMNGSPFVIVVPITNQDLAHAAEDNYLRFPYANLLRIVRVGAVFMSLLLPGIYIAITDFHHEMIPTDLLLAIASARERVPFPAIVEVLIMEVSFELIREAGIRIPGPIGPTLGIIGALILGQAAVAANIVSPILIIIVAVTGIGSFAIPNFSAGFAFRILRFAFILLAASAGFLGITTGIFLIALWFVNAKSFGVPYVSPFAPRTSGSFVENVLKAPVWKQEKRPDYMNVKKDKMQPKYSRAWDRSGDSGAEEEEE
ncbi:MAG TPA: spore germination protein [Pseudobacteroides sp.]|uniref:spore germination protein n=1 Tax=Pseudobacteroides sp. TaxID=1968840 RepID=UPI002F91D437